MIRVAAVGLRPVDALRGALLASLVLNLGRIPVLTTGQDTQAPLSVNDITLALALCVGALSLVARRSLKLDAVGGAAILFGLIGGGSALAAVPKYGLDGFELLVSLAYLARWFFYFGAYLFVVNLVRRDDVEAVWVALERMLIVFATFGIFQSIFLPGFAQTVYPDSRIRWDWDAQGHRLVSTVLEPNIAASMLMLGLFVYLGRLSTGAAVPRWKPALFFVAMVMTLSRSGALGLLAGGAAILWWRGLSKRIVRFGLVLLAAGIVSLPKLIPFMQEYGKLSLGGSAAGRIVNLAQALSAFLDSPWFGVGFNTFGFFMERQGVERLGLATQSSDGGLLFAAAMTGVVGLTVYVTMLVLVVRRCRFIWRSARYSAEERGLAIGVAAGVIGLCVHSMFVNSLFSTAVLLPLWVLWGLTFAIAAEGEGAGGALSSPPTTAGSVVAARA